MATTVLGKRSRQSTNISSTKVKRRACAVEQNGENEAPIFIAHDKTCNSPGAVFQLDTPKSSPSSAIRSRARTVPAKHGEPGRRIPLSPESICSHSKTSEGALDTTSCVNPKQPQTPSASRYRDALSEKSPVTPRRFVTLAGAGHSNTPRTPRTPSGGSGPLRSVFNEARQTFTRSADPGPLSGRETERAELQSFVSQRLLSSRGGCIYVSGPPGTGKTAVVNEVSHEFKNTTNVHYAYINCMSVKCASDVYASLINELNVIDGIFDGKQEEALQSVFLGASASSSYFVVMDEIDQLINLDPAVLYNLFEWSMQPHSRLILIGIANALDLTDRFLPRLKARNLKPGLLPFLPYTSAQIATVLTSRSRSLLSKTSTASATFTPFLHPAAIQLISKKISSQTGDLRKAFDIALRCVELVENDTKEKFAKQISDGQSTPDTTPQRTPLGENINLASPSAPKSPSKISKPVSTVSSLFRELDVETAPRATLAHVVKVTSATFGNGTSQRLKSLNLQQKAILCSLVALEHKNREEAIKYPSTPSKRGRPFANTPTKQRPSAAPTMRALLDTYTFLCKRDNLIHALSSTEFRDIIGNLETLSLVSSVESRLGSLAMSTPSTPSKRGKRSGFGGVSTDDQRFSACVSMQELEVAVEGAGSGVLRSILSHGLD